MSSIDNVDELLRELETIGRQHRKHKDVKREQFDAMRKALLTALSYTLGDAYTDNMERIYGKWTEFVVASILRGFQ